jgi:hypothetical protein
MMLIGVAGMMTMTMEYFSVDGIKITPFAGFEKRLSG